MPTNTRKRVGNKAVFNIAYGSLLSLASAFLILGATAWLISTERMPESAMGTAAMAAAFLTGVIGGLFAALRNGGSAVTSALFTAALTAFVRLLAAAFAENGELFGEQSLWLTACILAGGAVAAVACAGKGRRRRR